MPGGRKNCALAATLLTLAAAAGGCGGGQQPADSAGQRAASPQPSTRTQAPSTTTSKPRQRDRHKPQAASPTPSATTVPVPQPVPAGSSAPAPRIKGSDGSIERFGVEAPTGDAQAIATLVTQLKAAWAAGDTQRLCDLTATPTIQPLLDMYKKAQKAAAAQGKEMPAPSCSAVMRLMARTPSGEVAHQLRTTRLLAIRVKGDRGFAILRHAGSGAGALAVVRQGSTWKAAALPPALVSTVP